MNLLFNHKNRDEIVKIQQEVAVVKAVLNGIALIILSLFIVQAPVLVHVDLFHSSLENNFSKKNGLNNVIESITTQKATAQSVLNIIETTGADA